MTIHSISSINEKWIIQDKKQKCDRRFMIYCDATKVMVFDNKTKDNGTKARVFSEYGCS